MRTWVLAVLLLLAMPASAASAASVPVVGISEAQTPLFGDPHFRALHFPTTRLLISYDAVLAARRGDDEVRSRIDPYLTAALDRGVQVLVAFQHRRGDDCWNRKRPCQVPSVAHYRKAVRAFLVRYPSVSVISPWNEANHPSQPTAARPRLAAHYANAAASACRAVRRHCTIVVADVLDAVDNQRASLLTFNRTAAWVRSFRSALRVPRRVCGIHNYSDVNRFRDVGTRAVMQALGCREYWLTEVGGVYRYRSFWTRAAKQAAGCRSAARCQLKAMRYLLRMLPRFPRVRRVYVHSWYTHRNQGFDGGLFSGDWPKVRPRPAFRALQTWVRRHPSATRASRVLLTG